MKTIAEIRRDNLITLIDTVGGGKLSALNEKLGLNKTDATLAQIKNGNLNSGTGKPRGMGDALARRIEASLDLPEGWMDNVHSNVAPEVEAKIEHLQRVAENLAPYAIDQLIKIGVALAEPPEEQASK